MNKAIVSRKEYFFMAIVLNYTLFLECQLFICGLMRKNLHPMNGSHRLRRPMNLRCCHRNMSCLNCLKSMSYCCVHCLLKSLCCNFRCPKTCCFGSYLNLKACCKSVRKCRYWNFCCRLNLTCMIDYRLQLILAASNLTLNSQQKNSDLQPVVENLPKNNYCLALYNFCPGYLLPAANNFVSGFFPNYWLHWNLYCCHYFQNLTGGYKFLHL